MNLSLTGALGVLRRTFLLLLAFLLAVTLAVPSWAGSRRRGPKNPYCLRPEVQAFVEKMHANHAMNVRHLLSLFSKIGPDQKVIKLIQAQTPSSTPGVKDYQAYRARYLDTDRIESGRRFARRHHHKLWKIAKSEGVPPLVILGVLGVETRYGKHTGKFSELQTLATLAFDYPESPKQQERRSLFQDQLEAFLLFCKETRRDPLKAKGSFAGAIGIPQFLPSSLRDHGLDGDQDGKVDIAHSVADAMASVARFLKNHGWEQGQPILWRVPDTEKNRQILAPLADGDPLPKHRIQALLDAGLELDLPKESVQQETNTQVILVDLPSPGQPTHYALGFKNFYAITRYNRSFFYAMSVLELGGSVMSDRQS